MVNSPTMASNYRQKCLDQKGEKCVECGDTDDIEVHHIDRDRSNDDIENLIPLCFDCHIEEHHDERTGATVGYRMTKGRRDDYWDEVSERNTGPQKGNGSERRESWLRDVDRDIIGILQEGRNNAPNIADRLEYTREYITERLNRLKISGVVEPIGNGIYELVPEGVPEE